MSAPSISEVLAQTLFVGNAAAAESSKELKSRGITHILSVTNESCRRFPDSFTYLVFDILDDFSQPILDLFDRAHAYIGSQSRCDVILNGTLILIFQRCRQGRRRINIFALQVRAIGPMEILSNRLTAKYCSQRGRFSQRSLCDKLRDEKAVHARQASVCVCALQAKADQPKLQCVHAHSIPVAC